MAIKNGVKDVAQTATDVTAIKAVTDNLPDSGALTSISTETDKITSIKAVTDLIIPPITQATGTLAFDETSAAEQIVVTLTIAARSQIGAIWLDMVNVTQDDITIKVYHKVDGTNFREFQSNAWATTDSDGVLIDGFVAYRDVKVTLTSTAGGGAGSVNVPYTVV